MVERGEDQRAGGLDAPDDLDDQVHVVAGHQPGGVGRQQVRRHVHLASGVEAAYGDPHQLDGAPTRASRSPACSVSSRTTCEPTEPQPEHRDPEPVRSLVSLTHHAPTSVDSTSSSVSRLSTTEVFPSRTAITGGRSAWL